ncbi:HMG box-containing protein C19G7.04 [Apiospora rasikravindrae]|uniref:HMG box-containing protein C19G7.04 n=1 Tax=Apiospora rasikravindrae TaxID=990691 RepID=A0ABR1RZ31_9PEZI
MSRTASHEFSSDDEESFPSLDFLSSKRSPSKTMMSPAKKATAADKENAPLQPPRTLKSKRHINMDPSTPGSMAKPTPLRRRQLGNSQAIDKSLFQKWGEIEPLRKEKKERLASNPRSLRLKASNLPLSSHDATEISSLDATNLDMTKLDMDISLSDSDDTIIRRKRSPRKVSGNNSKLRERKRPVTVFDESSEEEKDDEESSASSSAEEESIEASKFSTKDETIASDGEESDFVTALSLDTDCTESSSSEFEVQTEPAVKPKSPSKTKRASPEKKQTQAKPARKATASRSSPDESPSDSGGAPHTPPRKTSRRADDKKPSADDLDDAFKKLKIFSEENDDELKKPKLDPVTPRKVLLPTKGQKIPTSPWKPEHSEFWDPEVQNKQAPRKLAMDGGDVNTKAALKLKYGTSPEKRDAKKAFNAVKESVAERFLAELDEKVTDGQLSKLTASTGGITIKWSTTLQSTAGRAHWKCKETTTMTEQPDGTMATSGGKQKQHTAHIELATKVLLNEPDLLNTVAHEFCHLATFMLDGKPKAAHGAEFKRWGAKCSRAFGDRGIVVTTKHNYEIEYKYIWRCVECLTEVQRHSKSVDPVKHRCGRCKGVLQQVKPVPRGSKAAAGGDGAAGTGEKKEKKVSAYQEFTGQQMKALKAENKGMTFGEMMSIVSSRWKAHQAAAKAVAEGEEAKNVTTITETMQEMSVADMST